MSVKESERMSVFECAISARFKIKDIRLKSTLEVGEQKRGRFNFRFKYKKETDLLSVSSEN